jgi:plastocyanin
MQTVPALLVSVLLTAIFAGCTGDTPTSTNGTGGTTGSGGTGTTTGGGSETRSVDLYDNYYENGNLTVPVGTTIKYSNEGTHGHTVTIHWAGSSGVQGDPLTTYKIDKTLQHGESTTYTFAVAGTYHVFCRFHGTMTTGMATIVHAG